jgi:predicted regulator of Ras-like GTPase activity (Roadblock/LC7/MglB family)
MPVDERYARVAKVSHLLDDKRLLRIQKLPGVLAVVAFYEGFPVKSMGSGDFEQVAALVEDFLRAGERFAADMKMGRFRQVILETGERKCIIAPYGDLCLCLLTKADTNLGLIRLAIRNLQIMEGQERR